MFHTNLIHKALKLGSTVCLVCPCLNCDMPCEVRGGLFLLVAQQVLGFVHFEVLDSKCVWLFKKKSSGNKNGCW